MTTIKNVALTGASGNLGPAILNAFIDNGSFNITVVARQESTATFPSSVKVAKIDYSPESLVSAFQGQDAVISIAGGGQLSDQTKYIDAAIKAGVKRFIPSEFGSDGQNERFRDLVPLFKPKADILAYLESKESDSFSWTSIANGPFFDWGLKVGFLGFNLQDRSAKIWDDGETPFTTTNLSTIGLGVVRTLLPEYVEATKNQHVYIESYTTTQNAILAEFEKLTGQKWKVEKIDCAPLIAGLKEKISAGETGPGVGYPLIQAGTFASGLGNLGDTSSKVWNAKLGLPKADFEADVKTILDGKSP